MVKFVYKLLSIISLFVVSAKFSHAQLQGCALTNSGNPAIYIDEITGYTTRFDRYGDDITYSATRPSLSTCNNFYISRGSFGSNGSCRIYYSTNTYLNGYLVAYYISCPLDSNVIVILMLSGLYGILAIRVNALKCK